MTNNNQTRQNGNRQKNRKNSNRQNSAGSQNRAGGNNKQTSAYRFVPLNEQVVEAPVKFADISHGKPIKGNISGKLTVKWVAETPLLVGRKAADNAAEPIEFGDKHPVIPGASLRGMIRAVHEIATFSALRFIDSERRFAYRDFNQNKYRKVIQNQSAGWLTKKENRWYLQPCEFALISYDELIKKEKNDGLKKNAANLRGKDMAAKYAALEKIGWAGNVKVTLRNAGARKLAHFSNSQSSQTGRIIPTGKGPNKKHEYIFYGTKQQRYRLPDNVMKRFFQFNSRPGNRGLEPEGNWAFWSKRLSDNPDARIPIFYADLSKQLDTRLNDDNFNDSDFNVDRFHMGLTRLLKVPYTNSIGDLLNNSQDDAAREIFDLTLAVFGSAPEDSPPDNAPLHQKLPLKGRVSFGFARCLKQVNPGDYITRRAIIMGPRASFYPFYLLQDGGQGYDNAQAKLQGPKRFPVRDRTSLQDAPSNTSEAQLSIMRFLRAGKKNDGELAFESEIRLHNLHPVEAGSLLWALSFGDLKDNDFRHALGRAKAFGFGQIRVEIQDCDLTTIGGDKTPTQNELISRFLGYMERALTNDKLAEDSTAPASDGTRYHSLPQIRALRAMADPLIGSKQRSQLLYPAGFEAHAAIKRKYTGKNLLRYP